MKSYRLFPLLMVLFLWMTDSALGQYITAYVDTTNHLIGDHLHLYIQANVEEESEIAHTDLGAIDTSGFEVIDAGKWRHKQEGRTDYFIRDVTLTRYDSGYFRIPPVILQLHLNDGERIREKTPWIPVLFDVPHLPSPQPAAIKDIYEEPRSWKDYLRYIIGLVVLGALIGLYWWYKQRKKIGVTSPPPPDIPPVEEALDALDVLRQRALWQQGKVKEHYSEVSQILRKYLERKYGFPALEWTKREIRRHLQKEGSPDFPIGPLVELLRTTDLVKFAKYRPEQSRHIEVLEEAKGLISRMERLRPEVIISTTKEEEE